MARACAGQAIQTEERGLKGDDLILSTLKQYLRPFRPVLGPVWVRVRPYVEPGHGKQAGPTKGKEAWSGPVPSAAGANLPIRVLSESEFEAVAALSPSYYKSRCGYMSAAARIAQDLIERHQLRTALELGPHLRSLVVGADVIDRVAQPDLVAVGKVVVADATVTPWPVGDDEYDLFVGLQVFEHLVGKQQEAFREVRRVAKHAVISLPIDWVMNDPANCHHQISHERALSWFAPTVPTRVEVGNPGPGKRLIYVFEDLAS